MMNRLIGKFGPAMGAATLTALLAMPAAWAQVPVDENGELIGSAEALGVEGATGNEEIPLLSSVDLEELVGPIALYPDDLLAIVLPASAYPLQIVDAARFLEALEDDPSLEPNPDWDDSVVALTNYPEVVELLNEDIDWTWRLGEAVVSQQADVVAAIETFRDRAYAAGNLKSDSYQNVSRDDGVIEITPVSEDVIYVPYYEPERVVVYQPRPVYYYYPRPYPVYYYPYPSYYAFDRGYFWGVTTAFSIGWYTDSLNVFHHSYYGHPYYGRSYWDRWWYRRPTINIYNRHYVGGNTTVTVNHYNRGDRWRPRGDRREYLSDRRITRNRTYPVRRQSSDSVSSFAAGGARVANRGEARRREQDRQPIAFRERPQTSGIARGERANRATPQRRAVAEGSNIPASNGEARRREQNRQPIAFRQRPQSTTITRGERGERVAGADRQTPSRQATTQRSEAAASRSRPGNREAVVKERRAQPTPKLRRAEPDSQRPRAAAVRQAVRSETVSQSRSQSRRSAPTTRAVRGAAPAREQARSRVAAEPSRESAAPRAARSEPQRRQAASRESAPAKQGRKSQEKRARRRD